MLSLTPLPIFKIAFGILLVVINPVFAVGENRTVASEVEQLITFVENSACQFNRNGKWYDSVEAAKHIGKKYRYVHKRGLVKSTEDFIKYSATKSSLSGKMYMVQCADEELLKSSKWLSDELAKNRREK